MYFSSQMGIGHWTNGDFHDFPPPLTPIVQFRAGK